MAMTSFPRGGCYTEAACPGCGHSVTLHQEDSCYNPTGKCPGCGGWVSMYLEVGFTKEGRMTLTPRLTEPGLVILDEGGEGQ